MLSFNALKYPLLIHFANTKYEGPNRANHTNRKSGVFNRKLDKAAAYFIDILINVIKKDTIMLDVCFDMFN